MHAGLGTTADGDVTPTRSHQASGGADGMGSSGAGGDDDLRWPVPTLAHGDPGRTGVGHHHGNQSRRDPPGTLLAVHHHLFGQGVEAADAGGEDDPGLGRIGLNLSGVLHGHVGRGDAELGEAVELARFLAPEPLLGFEVADLTADDRRGEQAFPERLDAGPATGHRSETGDSDPPTRYGAVRAPAQLHQSLPLIRSKA